jgi:hypothetical protein
MNPTPYPELNGVLQELVVTVQAALEDNFVAACLQGSFAVGDFDLHSDVDFIIVTERGLSADHVQALQSEHERIYHLESSWAQHLEGSYFPRAILRHYTHVGRRLWYLDHGAQTLIKSDHCNTVVVRWTVREYGVALVGPSPRSLVDPIPQVALQREILATMQEWGHQILADPERINNRFYQGFAVLSYCRMLRDLENGDTGSKRDGAEWAKANLDSSWSGLIDRAWAGRPDPARSVREPADPQELRKTLAFVEYVMDEGMRAAAVLKL